MCVWYVCVWVLWGLHMYIEFYFFDANACAVTTVESFDRQTANENDTHQRDRSVYVPELHVMCI